MAPSDDVSKKVQSRRTLGGCVFFQNMMRKRRSGREGRDSPSAAKENEGTESCLFSSFDVPISILYLCMTWHVWSRRGNGLKSSPDGPQPPPALGDLPDDLTIPVATSARVRIKKQYLAKYSTNIVLLRRRCNRTHWNSGPRPLHPQILNAGPSECSRPSCLAASAA